MHDSALITFALMQPLVTHKQNVHSIIILLTLGTGLLPFLVNLHFFFLSKDFCHEISIINSVLILKLK